MSAFFVQNRNFDQISNDDNMLVEIVEVFMEQYVRINNKTIKSISK